MVSRRVLEGSETNHIEERLVLLLIASLLSICHIHLARSSRRCRRALSELCDLARLCLPSRKHRYFERC
jgi:hypothetical protein